MNLFSKLTAKGRLAAVLMLGVVTLFSGCKEDDPPAISVSQQMFRIGTEAADLALRVMSNADWVSESNADWVMLSKESGRGSADLILYVDDYEAAVSEGRQATIIFRTTGANPDVATVIINQGKHNATLTVSPSEYTIGAAGGKVSFAIISNTEWEILGYSEWATLPAASTINGKGNQVIVLDVAANPDHNAPRETEFFVTTSKSAGNVITESFKLTQKGLPEPSLILGQETVNFPAVVTTDMVPHKIPVITNVDLTNVKLIVDEGPYWCTVDTEEEDGISYVVITDVEDNESFDPRTGIITVILTGLDQDGSVVMKQITVTQDAANSPHLDVLASVVNIAAYTGTGVAGNPNVTKTVGYISNVSTDVKDWPEWFTGKPTVNDGTITFIAAPNYAETERAGTMTVVASAGGVSVTRVVTILQQGIGEFTVTVTPSAINLPATAAAGDKFTVYIHSSTDNMTISSVMQTDGSWLTPATPAAVAVPAGTSYTMNVEYTSNDSHSARTGTLQIFCGAGSQARVATVNVTQNGIGGPEIAIIPTIATIGNAQDAELELLLLNAENATIITSLYPSDWLTATVSGTKDKITLKALSKNDAVDTRTATLFVRAEQGGAVQVVEIAINQPGTGGAILDLYKTIYEVGADAIQFNVPVFPLNESEWTIISVDGDVSMFKTAPAKAQNGGNDIDAISVDIDDNNGPARVAEIILQATNGDDHQFYTIVIKQEGQKGPEVEALDANVFIGPEAIAANDDHIIPLINTDGVTFGDVYTAAWLTGSKINTDGDGVILVVTANPSASERTGTISFAVTKGGITEKVTINVTQYGAATPSLTIAPTSFRYGPEEVTDGAVTFINPTKAVVTVHSKPAWVTPAVPTLDGFTFTATANTGVKSREGEIILLAANGDLKAFYTISVFQYGVDGLATSIAPTAITYDWDLENTALNETAQVINKPTDATAVLEFNSGATWLTPNVVSTSGVISFTAISKNLSAKPRTATVVVKVANAGNTESQYLTVMVTQEGSPAPNAYLPIASVNFTAAGTGAGDYEVKFLNYNNPTPTTGVAATGENSWIEVSTAYSTTDGTFKFKVGENTGEAREGSITITLENQGLFQQLVLKVTQDAAAELVMPTVRLGYSSIGFDAAGGDKTVPVYFLDDATWTYSFAAPDWVTIDAAGMTAQNPTFKVTAGTNPDESRTGIIEVTIRNGAKEQVIELTVTQNSAAASAAPAVSLEVNSLEFAYDATAAVNIPINGYDAQTMTPAFERPQWLTATIANGEVVITPTANTGSAARTGVVAVKVSTTNGGSTTMLIDVIQYAEPVAGAPVVSFDKTDITYVIGGGANAAANINGFDANYDYFWTVPSWITATPVANAAITLTAADNTGNAPRTGTAYLTVVNSQGDETVIKIDLAQEGVVAAPAPYITLSVPEVNFAAADDNQVSQTSTIVDYNATDFTYSMDLVGTWFTAAFDAQDADKIVVKPNAANTGEPLTGKVIVTVKNADNVTKQIELEVNQAGTLPMNIFPVAYSVSFDANSTSETSIEIANYVAGGDYGFEFTTSNGGWFTVTPPNSPMKIKPNTVWTGAEARTGTVHVTITKNGEYYTNFDITVIQNPEVAPNITYAPAIHKSVPVEGTDAGFPLKTIFINPEGLTLGIASTISPSFITSAAFNGDVLEITVAPSTLSGPRQTNVVVTATNAGGAIVGAYSVTVSQDGTATSAPTVLAQFADGGTMFVTQSGIDLEALMILDPTVSIVNASVSTGQAWLNNTITTTANSIKFTVDEDDFGTDTERAIIAVELQVAGGNNFTVYYNVIHQILPKINASLADLSTSIDKTAQDVEILFESNTLDGATISKVEAFDLSTRAAIPTTAIDFVIDQNTPKVTAEVAENDVISMRSARVDITLTKTNHQTLVLPFIIYQDGKDLLTLDVEWASDIVLDYNEGSGTYTPEVGTNTHNAVIDNTTVSFIFPNGTPAWISNPVVTGDQIVLTFADNDTGKPRFGEVRFTMTNSNVDYDTQECSIQFAQDYQVSGNIVATVPNIVGYDYQAGSYYFDVADLPAGAEIVSGSFTVDISGLNATTNFITSNSGDPIELARDAIAADAQRVTFDFSKNPYNATRALTISFDISDGNDTSRYSVIVNQNANPQGEGLTAFMGTLPSGSGIAGWATIYNNTGQGTGTNGDNRVKPFTDGGDVELLVDLPPGVIITSVGSNMSGTLSNPAFDYYYDSTAGGYILKINFTSRSVFHDCQLTITFTSGTTTATRNVWARNQP